MCVPHVMVALRSGRGGGGGRSGAYLNVLLHFAGEMNALMFEISFRIRDASEAGT
jgi:hypothetical protein